MINMAARIHIVETSTLMAHGTLIAIVETMCVREGRMSSYLCMQGQR